MAADRLGNPIFSELSDRAEKLDSASLIAAHSDKFSKSDLYVSFNNNSLGCAPRSTPDVVSKLNDQWQHQLVRGWWESDWYDAPIRVGDKIGSMVGAAPGQSSVGDAASVQLFNALVAACRLTSGRSTMLVDGDSFPTDLYIAQSVASIFDLALVSVSASEMSAELAVRGEETSVVLLQAVDFRTSHVADMKALQSQATKAGAIAVWDLSHAVGAIPLDLDEAGVDIAVACTYKYLCGGPGSPAFVYCAERHLARLELPIAGWHGHQDPFAMLSTFAPAEGSSRLRISTPAVYSLTVLENSVDTLASVGIDLIREHTRTTSELLTDGIDALGLPLRRLSPDFASRGGHVAFDCHDPGQVEEYLLGKGILLDSRPPSLVRLSTASPAISHRDVVRLLRELHGAVAQGVLHD